MNKIFIFIVAITFFNSCKNTKSDTQNTVLNNESIEVEKTKDSVYRSTITFPSKDTLPITADVYRLNENPITILLCHQAGFSRGEYKDTALALNDLGYSVMAIDQRSGKIANDILNETAQAAKAQGLPTAYLNARQDIEAAIDYLYNANSNTPILLIGSSYSASLALLIGESNPKVKAVAAFSPGEYFKGMNINEAIKDYSKPVFVTASKNETEGLTEMVSQIDSKFLTHYKPLEKGIHGSRALWSSTEGVDGYWNAFKLFLKVI